MKLNKITIILVFVSLLLGACTTTSKNKKSELESFEHNKPLIKEDIKKLGQEEMEKTIEMGPKPIFGDIQREDKRKKITSEKVRNYLTISDEFPQLKQTMSLKFKNIDFKEAMQLMAKIGEVNILVGDEVAGEISAELIDVPWDKSFQALLDMKNYAADIDVSNNLIRVHSPETLTQQETYKSERATATRKKVEIEESVEPIFSEIFIKQQKFSQILYLP